MDDFSNMDTSVYWDRAKKYLPPQIDMLFIAESPPAFKDSNKKAYFYFENSYGGDILFATIMKAIFHVHYHKNPAWKKALLKQFQRRKYFLIDAVPYPINRDTKWRKVPARVRIKQILKNKQSLSGLLNDLEKKK
jgi:hypothetical protein